MLKRDTGVNVKKGYWDARGKKSIPSLSTHSQLMGTNVNIKCSARLRYIPTLELGTTKGTANSETCIKCTS